MAFGRGCSILFYILIATVTCSMAYQVKQWQRLQFQGKIKRQEYGCMMRAQLLDKLFTVGIFVVLFVIMALRFDIGNDYEQYTQTAHEVFVDGYVVTELGFNVLVKILYGLTGGEYYEVIFAVFAFFTLLFFFKAFKRQSVNFAQTFFLFMTLGLYFQTFNTMRYYLALAIALFSMKYVLEKDYIKFVFWILIAALFHKSVLLVLPAYWIATFEWKQWHILAGLMFCVVCFLGKGFVLKLALVLYPSYKNTVYLEGGSSWTSILRILAVLVLYFWFCFYAGEDLKSKSWYREFRFYGQLNMFAFAASTFFAFLPVVTRIAYYFGVSQLFLIPLIVEHVAEMRTCHETGRQANITVEKRVKAVVFMSCLVYFMLFLLQAHRDGVGLLPYRSWLFETERYYYK